jgi:hypothetical protein
MVVIKKQERRIVQLNEPSLDDRSGEEESDEAK